MEDPVVPVLSASLSTVVRDFSGSRLEEELLAQSYEQVCPWMSLFPFQLGRAPEQGAVA
jgi:hypothetical protein